MYGKYQDTLPAAAALAECTLDAATDRKNAAPCNEPFTAQRACSMHAGGVQCCGTTLNRRREGRKRENER